jgi:hypothetical protein
MNGRLKIWTAAGVMAAFSAALLAQAGGANVSILSGPHKGEYGFAPTQSCIITAFGDRPAGISLVLTSQQSSLSIDMPDFNRANELQVVLVVADGRSAGGAGKSSSTTYEIDTRPDSSLEAFKLAERARKGTSGKATTTTTQKGESALISFSGETAAGVKLEGSVLCHKVTSGAK